MRLKEQTSIFNMGDTSIRVKEIIPIYKQTLKVLHRHNQDNKEWNNISQELFYRTVISEFEHIENEEGLSLFGSLNRNETTGLDKRGRTLTNALVKLGFVDSKRQLTPVGKNYISKCVVFDELEKLFGLTDDNIIYLRQLLKLRVYDSRTDQFIYPFRIALVFLTRYKSIPIKDFLWILESIKPSFSKEKIQALIDNYEKVYRNQTIFEAYCDEEFSDYILLTNRVAEAHLMFEKRDFSDDNFKRLFPNRKNSETSLRYKHFVLTLIEFLETQTKESLERLLNSAKGDAIKKAFGGGKAIFESKKNDTVIEFIERNSENILLSGKYFDIYLTFAWSKHNDLIKEYSDMCRRIFSLSGVIKFDKGIASLGQPWLIPKIIKMAGENFALSGDDSYEEYENNQNGLFFRDISLSSLLNISEEQVSAIKFSISKEFGISDITNLQKVISDKQEEEFREFVENKFDVSTVITILEAISRRDDKIVQDLVTDNALVPTIFEYMLAIAWYYISNKTFELRKSMQLTFSADNLPLSHAEGNKGDIEIEYEDRVLQLEATLMDKSTQKRGELEPVIRHSVNLALSTNKPSQTIFVANEVDNNVVNIFRATSFVQLDGTLTAGTVNGLNIFALTIPEIVEILKCKIDSSIVFSKIEPHYKLEPHRIETGWRERIVEEILA